MDSLSRQDVSSAWSKLMMGTIFSDLVSETDLGHGVLDRTST